MWLIVQREQADFDFSFIKIIWRTETKLKKKILIKWDSSLNPVNGFAGSSSSVGPFLVATEKSESRVTGVVSLFIRSSDTR